MSVATSPYFGDYVPYIQRFSDVTDPSATMQQTQGALQSTKTDAEADVALFPSHWSDEYEKKVHAGRMEAARDRFREYLKATRDKLRTLESQDLSSGPGQEGALAGRQRTAADVSLNSELDLKRQAVHLRWRALRAHGTDGHIEPPCAGVFSHPVPDVSVAIVEYHRIPSAGLNGISGET